MKDFMFLQVIAASHKKLHLPLITLINADQPMLPRMDLLKLTLLISVIGVHQ